jgi:hypothetical protein
MRFVNHAEFELKKNDIRVKKLWLNYAHVVAVVPS